MPVGEASGTSPAGTAPILGEEFFKRPQGVTAIEHWMGEEFEGGTGGKEPGVNRAMKDQSRALDR